MCAVCEKAFVTTAVNKKNDTWNFKHIGQEFLYVWGLFVFASFRYVFVLNCSVSLACLCFN